MSVVTPDGTVDYTAGTVGCAYSREGVIAICPACERPGERRHKTVRGLVVYVHAAEVHRGRSSGKSRLKVTAQCEVSPSKEARR